MIDSHHNSPLPNLEQTPTTPGCKPSTSIIIPTQNLNTDMPGNAELRKEYKQITTMANGLHGLAGRLNYIDSFINDVATEKSLHANVITHAFTLSCATLVSGMTLYAIGLNLFPTTSHLLFGISAGLAFYFAGRLQLQLSKIVLPPIENLVDVQPFVGRDQLALIGELIETELITAKDLYRYVPAWPPESITQVLIPAIGKCLLKAFPHVYDTSLHDENLFFSSKWQTLIEELTLKLPTLDCGPVEAMLRGATQQECRANLKSTSEFLFTIATTLNSIVEARVVNDFTKLEELKGNLCSEIPSLLHFFPNKSEINI